VVLALRTHALKQCMLICIDVIAPKHRFIDRSLVNVALRNKYSSAYYLSVSILSHFQIEMRHCSHTKKYPTPCKINKNSRILL
jgi:hypothetical protein